MSSGRVDGLKPDVEAVNAVIGSALRPSSHFDALSDSEKEISVQRASVTVPVEVVVTLSVDRTVGRSDTGVRSTREASARSRASAEAGAAPSPPGSDGPAITVTATIDAAMPTAAADSGQALPAPARQPNDVRRCGRPIGGRRSCVVDAPEDRVAGGVAHLRRRRIGVAAEPRHKIEFGQIVHVLSPSGEVDGFPELVSAASEARSRPLAREMRERTVPTGIPRVSAIWS